MTVDDSPEVRRRDVVGGLALAAISTGLVLTAVVRNPLVHQFHTGATAGHAWIVAGAVVLVAVGLAAIGRTTVGQWLRRYAAAVALLAPAALIMTGRFDAGWDVDDCGTLVDRNTSTTLAGLARDCAAEAGHRLNHAIIWAAVAVVVMVAWGVRARVVAGRAGPGSRSSR
ncbi:hypothetical protein KOI35_16860 [Actinoplanes bogorensis]|uniref:Integral membrane protein n=1 Tax=Paractinoplanes bogorensis TaxID=1610840 RepID=A0ABS5YT03_9ACTN|nr:hypothetical protein [Actinoplanes bogorensis]MBU2665175.1 hypothetical protein [Actinoplanes bogorensis]